MYASIYHAYTYTAVPILVNEVLPHAISLYVCIPIIIKLYMYMPHTDTVPLRNAADMYGTGEPAEMLLEDLLCSGSEHTLLECPRHQSTRQTECGSSELAGVKCDG